MLSKLQEPISLAIDHSTHLAKDFSLKTKSTDKSGLVNDFLGINTLQSKDTEYFYSKDYLALSANAKRELLWA